MLRVLSQLASDNVFAQPSIFFSVGLLRNKLHVPHFVFQVYCNTVEQTGMYQLLQKICRKVCRMNVFWAVMGKFGQSILFAA